MEKSKASSINGAGLIASLYVQNENRSQFITLQKAQVPVDQHKTRYINNTNWQPADWGKIFTNPTSDIGLISKIYKELKKLTSKNPNLKKLVLCRAKQKIHNRGILSGEKHLNKCSSP